MLNKHFLSHNLSHHSKFGCEKSEIIIKYIGLQGESNKKYRFILNILILMLAF